MIRFIMFVYFYSYTITLYSYTYNTFSYSYIHILSKIFYIHIFWKCSHSFTIFVFNAKWFSQFSHISFFIYFSIISYYHFFFADSVISFYYFFFTDSIISFYYFFFTDNVSILKIILWITLEFYVIFQNYLYLTVKNESKSKKHEKKRTAKWW